MSGAIGAFGKMPALGDFFRLNVSQGFVQAWDGWLQRLLPLARAEHGAGWTDCYMSAPIWRFALSPGLAGPEAVAGVMMPSVDRVGRQFPLTLVATIPADAPLRVLALQEAALSELEVIALDALDDTITREALQARLETVSLKPAPGRSAVRLTPGGYAVASDDALALLPDLALRFAPAAPAVFGAVVDGQAHLLAGGELPGSCAAAALFDLGAPFWSGGPA